MRIRRWKPCRCSCDCWQMVRPDKNGNPEYRSMTERERKREDARLSLRYLGI